MILVPPGVLEQQGISAPNTLLDGLHAWWPMEEVSGTRFDAHTGGYNLTENTPMTRVAGVVGYAAQGPGELRITEAAAPWIEPGNTDFTYAFWFNYTWLSNAGFFGRWGSGNSYIMWTTVGASGTISWGSSAGATKTGIANNTWYHAICEYDSVANFYRLYINNGTPATKADSVGPPASSEPLRIGRYALTANYITSKFDEFAAWGRVLTAGERAALYNGGAGIGYPG